MYVFRRRSRERTEHQAGDRERAVRCGDDEDEAKSPSSSSTGRATCRRATWVREPSGSARPSGSRVCSTDRTRRSEATERYRRRLRMASITEASSTTARRLATNARTTPASSSPSTQGTSPPETSTRPVVGIGARPRAAATPPFDPACRSRTPRRRHGARRGPAPRRRTCGLRTTARGADRAAAGSSSTSRT